MTNLSRRAYLAVFLASSLTLAGCGVATQIADSNQKPPVTTRISKANTDANVTNSSGTTDFQLISNETRQVQVIIRRPSGKIYASCYIDRSAISQIASRIRFNGTPDFDIEDIEEIQSRACEKNNGRAIAGNDVDITIYPKKHWTNEITRRAIAKGVNNEKIFDKPSININGLNPCHYTQLIAHEPPSRI